MPKESFSEHSDFKGPSGGTAGGGNRSSVGGLGPIGITGFYDDPITKKKKITSSDPASNVVPSVTTGQPGSVPTTSPVPTPDDVDLTAPEDVATTPAAPQDDSTVAKKAKQQGGVYIPQSSTITGASGIFLP